MEQRFCYKQLDVGRLADRIPDELKRSPEVQTPKQKFAQRKEGTETRLSTLQDLLKSTEEATGKPQKNLSQRIADKDDRLLADRRTKALPEALRQKSDPMTRAYQLITKLSEEEPVSPEDIQDAIKGLQRTIKIYKYAKPGTAAGKYLDTAKGYVKTLEQYTKKRASTKESVEKSALTFSNIKALHDKLSTIDTATLSQATNRLHQLANGADASVDTTVAQGYLRDFAIQLAYRVIAKKVKPSEIDTALRTLIARELQKIVELYKDAKKGPSKSYHDIARSYLDNPTFKGISASAKEPAPKEQKNKSEQQKEVDTPKNKPLSKEQRRIDGQLYEVSSLLNSLFTKQKIPKKRLRKALQSMKAIMKKYETPSNSTEKRNYNYARIYATRIDRYLTDIDTPEEIKATMDSLRSKFGNTLNMSEADTPGVQEHLEELNMLPKKLVTALREKGVKVRISDTDMPGMSDDPKLKQAPRGHASATWDGVPGAFDPETKTVFAGKGKHASNSLVLHEYGHAVGHVLGLKDSPDVIAAHKRLYKKLFFYHQQDGPGGEAGRDEFLADSLADYYIKPEEKFVKKYDQKWYTFMKTFLKKYE